MTSGHVPTNGVAGVNNDMGWEYNAENGGRKIAGFPRDALVRGESNAREAVSTGGVARRLEWYGEEHDSDPECVYGECDENLDPLNFEPDGQIEDDVCTGLQIYTFTFTTSFAEIYSLF